LVPSRVPRLPATLLLLQAGISQFEAAESNFIPGKAVGYGLYRNKGPHKGLYRTEWAPCSAPQLMGPPPPPPPIRVKPMAEGFTKCKELSQFFLNGRKMKKNCEVFQIWNGHWSGAFCFSKCKKKQDSGRKFG